MKNKLFIILIIFVGLFAVKALFHSGFYTSHDGRHQIIRLSHFHQGLADGQFPVRWAGRAMAGYGYPLFVFTYRLPFWLGEVFYLIFNNLAVAIKAVFVTSYLLSGLAVYWLSSSLWSSRLAGFFSSVLYLWAPYRFVNIFVRASLGEEMSLVFIPLLYLGIYWLSKKDKHFSWLILTAVSFAAVVLSHAIVLGLWFIPVFVWAVINFLRSKNKFLFVNSLFFSGLLGLLLSFYYWLPALVERKYVNFSAALGDYYKDHFVTLKQLLYSKWGYGFSMGGVDKDMMSFQIGIGQWLVILSTFVLFVLLFVNKSLFSKKMKFTKYIKAWFKKLNYKLFLINKEDILFLIYFFSIFLLSVFLMLPLSDFFYHFIKKYLTIDIPWRFLGVAVFCSSLIFGGLVKMIKHKSLKLGFIVLVLFLAFYGNRNHLRVNKYLYLTDFEYWQSNETTNQHNDYQPKSFSYQMLDQDNPELMTLSGVSTNKLVQRKSNLFRFYSEVRSKEAEIVAKIAYYPGWQLYIDAKKIDKILNQDGRIKINLDKGNHLVSLVFKETNLRRFSNYLSLFTLIGLIIFYFKYGRKKI